MNCKQTWTFSKPILLMAICCLGLIGRGAENPPAAPASLDPQTEHAARELLRQKIADQNAGPKLAANQEKKISDWQDLENRANLAAPPSSATRALVVQAAPPPAVGNKEQSAVLNKTEDQHLYSFRAEGQDLKLALSSFAQANGLNIVPDQDVRGEVTLDIHDLPLNKLLEALLEAHDFSWTQNDGLIRVRSMETRQFAVDYLRLSRKGIGQSTATLGSGGGASF